MSTSGGFVFGSNRLDPGIGSHPSVVPVSNVDTRSNSRRFPVRQNIDSSNDGLAKPLTSVGEPHTQSGSAVGCVG